MQMARHLWLGTMRLLVVAAISSGLLIGVSQVVHAAAPDAISVTASPATSATAGTTVTFTAKVESASLFIVCSPDITGCPVTRYTGTVDFVFTMAGATTITAAAIPLIEYDDPLFGGVGNGIATYPVSNLPIGVTRVTVHYNGRSDGGVDAANSTAPLDYTITAAPGNTVTTTTLAASANPAPSASPFTLTATVTPAGPPVPTGTVTFSEGATTLVTVNVNGSGIAAYASTGAFAAGSHTVIASYGGDATYAASTSSLTFTVTAIPTTTTGTALPSSVAGGFGLSLVVNVLPGGATIAGVSVDLRPIGIGLGPTPLANVTADTTWRKLVTVPATAPVGTFTLPVTLTDSASNPIIGAPLSVTIVRLVRSVSISPGNTQIIAGTTQPFTLTATYTDGTSSPVTTGVTWRVGSTQVATVDGTGRVTAGTAGSTLLIATYKEHSAQVTLTVVAGHGMPPAPQPLGTHADATAASTVIAPASAPATTHPSAPTPTSGAKPNAVPVRH